MEMGEMIRPNRFILLRKPINLYHLHQIGVKIPIKTMQDGDLLCIIVVGLTFFIWINHLIWDHINTRKFKKENKT